MSDTEYISKDAFVKQQREQYCVNCERRKGTKNGKRIFVHEIGEVTCRACDLEDMIDAVWDFLPADVAPVVHGRWIDKTDWRSNIGFCCYKCSNCGYVRTSKPKTRRDGLGGNFCENCGAKMDESEEEE